MINILRVILFASALSIILLHTFIPHPHSEEMTEERHFEFHQNSNSILDFLKLVFHESEDEGLDNLIIAQYQAEKKLKKGFHHQIATGIETLTLINESRTKKSTAKHIGNSNGYFIVKPNGVRGPPASTNSFEI
jgi:hypothetical protein